MKTIHGGKVTDKGAGISLTLLKPFEGYSTESMNSDERGRKGEKCQEKNGPFSFRIQLFSGVFFIVGFTLEEGAHGVCPMTASCLDG